jgi:hypothetical protein
MKNKQINFRNFSLIRAPPDMLLGEESKYIIWSYKVEALCYIHL